MGIDPGRLDNPIIGIASTWTGTMPCNLNQRDLAREVAAGVAEAGGVPLEFNTIAVSDNQSQGTPGMRASLISREVIADSIELMTRAHDFDALVCLVGCDKTVPAALMALARVDKPAVVLGSGPMRAGRLRGREVTIGDVWEAVGAEERGLLTREGGVELTIDELAAVADRTPVLASLLPSGRYAAEDFHRAGGTAVVIRELIRAGRVDGGAPAVEGTLDEAVADAPEPDGEVV